MRPQFLLTALSLTIACSTTTDEQQEFSADESSQMAIDMGSWQAQKLENVAPNTNPFSGADFWASQNPNESDQGDEGDNEGEAPTADDGPNPNPLPPVEGIRIYQEYISDDGDCTLAFETNGVAYDDKCEDCVFAFEVETDMTSINPDCEQGDMDSLWLLEDFQTVDSDGVWGVENIRLQFHQEFETPDKTLTNVLVAVMDVYEYLPNVQAPEVTEETNILVHDESDIGRAGVSGERVWWTIDDGVTRIQASGIFAR